MWQAIVKFGAFMKIGLENFVEYCSIKTKELGRCGLVCNQASVTRKFDHAIDVIGKVLGENLVALFGPQHGIVSTVQDNMIETGHSRHEKLKIPIYSLYSETRKPSKEMMSNLDTLILDLPIVGCRVYTYKATVKKCLEAAKEYGKKVLVLDRPNPLGLSIIEGRVPDDDSFSFVAPDRLPMRHGMTIGEVARFFNQSIGIDLDIIPLSNFSKFDQLWPTFNRPWVLPSPNLPSFEAALVYPGMVMLEGTNLSEGRGTSLPFQFLGAPYISNSQIFCNQVINILGKQPKGLHLRPTEFIPSFGKWSGEVCQGLQIHIVDYRKVSSCQLASSLLIAASNYKGFEWLKTPYEYEYNKLPINVIVGSEKASDNFKEDNLKNTFWREGVEGFINRSSNILLYQRERFCL